MLHQSYLGSGLYTVIVRGTAAAGFSMCPASCSSCSATSLRASWLSSHCSSKVQRGTSCNSTTGYIGRGQNHSWRVVHFLHLDTCRCHYYAKLLDCNQGMTCVASASCCRLPAHPDSCYAGCHASVCQHSSCPLPLHVFFVLVC